MVKRHSATAALAAAFMLPAISAGAQNTDPVVIGVLADLSGAYTDTYPASLILAAEMAIEDVGGKVGDRPIKLLSADMLQKVDVTTSIAREWIDNQGADIILGVPNSSAAIAVTDLVREKDKVFISTSAGSTAITGANCSPNTIAWSWDNYAVSRPISRYMVEQGFKDWFYLTADYTFGHNLEELSSAMVTEAGGKVLGAIRQPLGIVDQSSAILQAQGANPQVIGIASAGGDLENALKQLAEFGVVAQGIKPVPFTLHLTNIKALGLNATQGMRVANSWYWDMNEESRKWSERFMQRSGGIAPTYHPASVYSALINYFRTLEASPSESGAEIVKAMASAPTSDILFGEGQILPNGRRINPMYVFEVKSPGESTGPWDMQKLVATIPAEEAFQRPEDSGCSLVN